jgi:hypothetical protein
VLRRRCGGTIRRNEGEWTWHPASRLLASKVFSAEFFGISVSGYAKISGVEVPQDARWSVQSECGNGLFHFGHGGYVGEPAPVIYTETLTECPENTEGEERGVTVTLLTGQETGNPNPVETQGLDCGRSDLGEFWLDCS